MILLNSQELNFTRFPNQEITIDHKKIQGLINLNYTNTISFKYENNEDLIKLMFVKKYLDEYNLKTKLVIHYMPYSRMDRSENKSAFTLKYITDFINGLNFNEIYVAEPHSDITTALLNKCEPIYTTLNILKELLDNHEFDFDPNTDYICLPDAGAEKRYSKYLKGFNILVGFKQRNFDTGKILDMKILGEIQNKNAKVIILDDLCSRGGTFMLSANNLKQMGASKIYLVVTHCEDTIHKGEIFTTNVIDKVFTSNSIITNELNDKLEVMDIENLINKKVSIIEV